MPRTRALGGAVEVSGDTAKVREGAPLGIVDPRDGDELVPDRLRAGERVVPAIVRGGVRDVRRGGREAVLLERGAYLGGLATAAARPHPLDTPVPDRGEAREGTVEVLLQLSTDGPHLDAAAHARRQRRRRVFSGRRPGPLRARRAW